MSTQAPAPSPAASTPAQTRLGRYAATLLALAERDPEVLIMTAENRAPLRGLAELLGARHIDVGICEQTLIAAAAGLALRGRRPVVHALAAFLSMRAFEFIRTDVGVPGLPVVFMGYVPGLLSEANGPTHQALEDLALMRGIPGMNVFCPADEDELCEALPDILERGRPCYVRYTDRPGRSRSSPVRHGHAELLQAGAEGVSIVTHGALLHEARRATELLEARGVPVRLVNLRWIAPLDEAALLQAARAELLVTLEDHFLAGGLYTLVAETLLRARVTCRVLPIGFAGRWFRPGLLPDVLAAEGLDGPRLAARIFDALVAPRGVRPGVQTCPIE
jgi:transketolase